MGVTDVVFGFIARVRGGARQDDVIVEQEEDPFLSRSLEIDEELRTGKSRMLSTKETQRYFKKAKRDSR